jgi:hypothetical protein
VGVSAPLPVTTKNLPPSLAGGETDLGERLDVRQRRGPTQRLSLSLEVAIFGCSPDSSDYSSARTCPAEDS